MPVWPGRLLEIYGLTEGGVSTMLDLAYAGDKLDSIGRASAGVTIRIIGADNAVLPAGEIGEIVGNSPTVMRGYFNRPEQTDAVFVQLDDGLSYFRTGDLGYMDSDGYLHIAGRSKEVIVSGGFNIYASDLEAALLEHPAVQDAAVIGKPSEDWGETPHAFVVLRPQASDRAGLLDAVNAKLGKAQRISGMSIIDELPRNPAGKVLKRDLETLVRQDG
jgi:acyl-CoA synthetase (AMP-forming)/AMP-acid ligase II